MRLVLIDWVDSHRNPNSWTPLDEFPAPKPLVCRSVGWLAHDGNDCKVVIPHLIEGGQNGATPEQGCGDMTIPAQAILRMYELRAPAIFSRAESKRKRLRS